MISIVNTEAFNNRFFELSTRGININQAIVFIKEWYPVTEAFCLGLPSYVGLFADHILAADEERRDALEQAMLIPVAISSVELGGGGTGVQDIHFRMFARLGEPLGLTRNGLRSHARHPHPVTRQLVAGIRDSLADICKGAGCIRVVEGTAFRIVETMNALFRSVLSTNGVPVFSERDLEYITLHLEIEKGHDSMAADLISLLCATREEQEQVEDEISTMCRLFGEYWKTLADLIAD